MMAGKKALEALGLAKGEDIKDKAMFANIATTIVTAWAKQQGLSIPKATMESDIDTLRAIVTEGTVEQAIKGVEAFKTGKH